MEYSLEVSPFQQEQKSDLFIDDIFMLPFVEDIPSDVCHITFVMLRLHSL